MSPTNTLVQVIFLVLGLETLAREILTTQERHGSPAACCQDRLTPGTAPHSY